MSRYFSFLRKKRSPSLTDEAGEGIGPSLSPHGGKLRKHKVKKVPQHHIDDGFCDQRFSLQNYDFYDRESDDGKVVSSEVNSMHSDNDSLLDNLSYGEVCSSEGDKSLQWEKVETLTDDSRPSSSSESPRVDPKSDSLTLCDNVVNTSLEEDEGLAHERAEDYFSFDHKDLVEQVSLPELTEVDVGSHLIDDFMDEAFDDLEGCDEDVENDRSSGTCVGDSKSITEDVEQSIGPVEEPSVETLKKNINVQLEEKSSDHECNSVVNNTADDIANSLSTEDAIEASTSDLEIVAKEEERGKDEDEGSTVEQMQDTQVDLTTRPFEEEGESVITVPTIVTDSINTDDSSPPSVNDDDRSSDGKVTPNNDTGLNNFEKTLPEVKEGKFICNDVCDQEVLDADLLTATICDSDSSERDLVSEKNISCDTDYDKCEQEVSSAGIEYAKENLEEDVPQEIKVNALLENKLSQDILLSKFDEANFDLGDYDPNVKSSETEIKATSNSDFILKENLESALENTPIIVDEKVVNILVDERSPKDEINEQEKTDPLTEGLMTSDKEACVLRESACIALLDEAVPIKADETVIPADNTETVISADNTETVISADNTETVISADNTETVISADNTENVISADNTEINCEIISEGQVSGIDDHYVSDEISQDKETSGLGKEINLSTSEMECPCEMSSNQSESRFASNAITEKDIPEAKFLVEGNKIKAEFGNCERKAISVSTGTHSEFDDEFDSAKEDLTDDEADAVYLDHDSNLSNVDSSKHFNDSFNSEAFETTLESEPTLSVLCDTEINAVEVGREVSDSLLVPSRVAQAKVEMQNDVPDNSLVSIKDPGDNSCITYNVESDILVCFKNVSDFNKNSHGSLVDYNSDAINTSEIADEAASNMDEIKPEVVDTILHPTTASLVSHDSNAIVIACDEALIPTTSSQLNLNDIITKDCDSAEKSVESDSTLPKDDCDLLEEESDILDDALPASVINGETVLQNTANSVIESHNNAGRSDNDLKSTNDTSSSSSPSKKHSITSSDESMLFGHSDHLEAEARLAQRRAARAEARELRLRELEKQQLDQDDEDEQQYAANSFAPADKKLQNSASLPPRTNSPYIPKSSPRGVSGARGPAVRSSSLANSTGSGGGGGAGQFSRRSSEDSTPDDALPLSSRELKAELKELEEKFRKAMITNAQLDNEKATLTYEVEFLKDKYSDLEESHNQLTKEHRKKCSENETLRKLTNKLKEEVKMVRKVLQERDSLIQEYGLVLIGEENGEENGDDDHSHDEEMDDDTINDLSPRKIGVKKALLSTEASELLAKGAAQGSLDVRLKKYAECKNDLEDEVRRLKLELEDELSKRRKENGLDYEKQKEASKSINEYKFRVQKAEAEVSTLQANVARLESLVTRYKASTEELEKSEEDLKSEKRRLQRELREAQNRLDELELTTSHLQKRFDKLKTARSTLLKDLSQDPI